MLMFYFVVCDDSDVLDDLELSISVETLEPDDFFACAFDDD